MNDVLGNDFYNDLIEIKNEIQLDRTIFGYFDRCFLVNKLLAKYNIYTFQIKKKVEGKNTVTINLSSSVLEKFNGYEIIRHELARQEKREFVPIDIVYEPVYNKSVPVPRFFQAMSLLLKPLHQKRRYYEKTSSSMCCQRRHYLFFLTMDR